MLALDKFGFLTAYVAWALVSTAFLPYVFQGKILIYPISPENGLYVLSPLRYTGSNITQSMYILLSYIVSISIFIVSNEHKFIETIRIGIYALCICLIITGILDIIGFNDLLSLFRNANYALVGDSEIASTKRIVGATPEASSFGSLTASSFAVLLLMPRIFIHRSIRTILLITMLLLSILSTSSTAYGMVFAAGMVFILIQILGLSSNNRFLISSAIKNIGFLLLLFALLMIVMALYPSVKDQFVGLLDQLVFKKSSSSSYEERGRWTSAAMNALFDSNLLGIGMGSARTSNAVVGILSGGGIISAMFFTLFMIKIFFSSQGWRLALYGLGAQLSTLPLFAGLALAGPTADYGTFVAVLFGIQVGINSNSIKYDSFL